MVVAHHLTKGATMQLICVSRGTYDGGRRLAESLASKLGYSSLSREELSDAAIDAGIAVGKLEMAVLRRHPLSEQLNIEKERFKAFVTATLSQRAITGGLVYHGRTGHLQLPSVGHVMRVRAIMDPEMRIGLTMQRLGLTRNKAQQYIEQVDEDRHRWVRTLYNVEWGEPAQYDLTLNLSHVNVENAATALVAMAQLPEFQPTPANRRTLEAISLASRCRLAIGADAETRWMDVQVKVDGGRVLVTYLPRHRQLAARIPRVLQSIDGVEEIVCTMASTNLLWIQESYDAQSEALDQILDIATRWDSAVELIQLSGATAAELQPAEDAEITLLGERQSSEENGGILDDTAVPVDLYSDETVRDTLQRLITVGRAGGYQRVLGGPKDLLSHLDRTVPYSLIVVGDVFLSKEESVRKRLKRELVAYISDNVRTPVIGTDELKAQFSFGPRQWATMLLCGVLAALVFGLVFSHQVEVLTFLSREGRVPRLLGTASLLAVVPVFAYCLGNFTRSILQLLKFE
jgi:hypothetical protein